MIPNKIYLGELSLNVETRKISEKFSDINGELFYIIENYTEMPPFFMTLTSSSNHWMFISSTGGLTAGRINSESSLFPYYTDDRITESSVNTGPETIILVTKAGRTSVWKPFTEESRDIYGSDTIIAKNINGNILRFEEINEKLGLSFSYYWMNSEQYGIVRKSCIKNISTSSVDINIVDGLRNVLPSGVESQVQNEFSCLLNGYKRTEVDKHGLALFSLSAKLTDLAEPSESLKANTIWQTGLEVENYLLGENQLKSFGIGKKIHTEKDIKGDRGCFFVQSKFSLETMGVKEWIIVADLDKDLTEVNNLRKFIIETDNKFSIVLEDITKGSRELNSIINQNDGIQKTAKTMNGVHHRANVLFNIMRGGYFYNSYLIGTEDFGQFVETSNKKIYSIYKNELLELERELDYDTFLKFILEKKDHNLERIWYDYLPLTFSRRHGDPSRPWNRFSIETTKVDGSAKLDYQGNWRDIFQNWEALCFSNPEYLEHIIGKFLNASTKDGYNPYRISKSGIDWECPEPGNPWANIGYWSDHQIIYLLKLLEMYKEHKPDNLKTGFNLKKFTYANVPYEIKSFNEIIKDPYETIEFNEEKDADIRAFSDVIGAEGKMLHGKDGSIILGSLTEKLMIHLLTKLGNFIPEGGIWMNTQRPEWNDANNALVGKGISVVTMAYIRRYISFMIDLYSPVVLDTMTLGEDIFRWFNKTASIFSDYESCLDSEISDLQRFKVTRLLGIASEEFRNSYYRGIEFADTSLSVLSILNFLRSSLKCIDDSLYKNRREDHLFHSYNTLEIKNGELKIHYLYEMLEGQVAILTSGLLTPVEAVETFIALRESSMYREDQNSYMLYPNRELSGFRDKNIIPGNIVKNNVILNGLIKSGNRELITCDQNGEYHFNGDFHNVKQVRLVLKNLGFGRNHEIETIFEETFDHQSFTGRSGTFFAYEGLGSIYWHMVSKLLLAAQENLFRAVEHKSDKYVIKLLRESYYDIRNGIGYNKKASIYGAFPFDPYSHTPFGKGAKQPGMTGQVKEEIITRLAEMGITIRAGEIVFSSILIDEEEFLKTAEKWKINNNSGMEIELDLPKGSFAGTHCQTPYILRKGSDTAITIHFTDETVKFFKGSNLPVDYSSMIFKRDNRIKYLEIELNFK